MIPQEMANRELAKAEAEIAKWELRVMQQRERIRALPYFGTIDREPAERILAIFEAALTRTNGGTDCATRPPSTALLQSSKSGLERPVQATQAALT